MRAGPREAGSGNGLLSRLKNHSRRKRSKKEGGGGERGQGRGRSTTAGAEDDVEEKCFVDMALWCCRRCGLCKRLTPAERLAKEEDKVQKEKEKRFKAVAPLKDTGKRKALVCTAFLLSFTVSSCCMVQTKPRSRLALRGARS